MPYLDPAVAQSAKTYLQSEYAAYNPTVITHVGWKDGASRDWHDLPTEVDADRVNYPPTQWGEAMNSSDGVKNTGAPTYRRMHTTLCGSMLKP